MKTAISVPDSTFERATQQAKQMGISRSELFTRAVERYLSKLDDGRVTEQINAAVDALNADESTRWAAEAGRRTLSRSEW